MCYVRLWAVHVHVPQWCTCIPRMLHYSFLEDENIGSSKVPVIGFFYSYFLKYLYEVL